MSSTETSWTLDEFGDMRTLCVHRPGWEQRRDVATFVSTLGGRMFVDDLQLAVPLWHAGTAVLAPTDEQRDLVAQACGDPGSILPREPGESISRWSGRAVLAALRTDAEATR